MRSLADPEEAVVRTGSEMRAMLLEAEGKGGLVLSWWKVGQGHDLW